jgi:hypothetical protein
MISSGSDPQLHFQFRYDVADQLRGCRVLRFKGTISAQKDDTLQVFFNTPNSPAYSEESSVTMRYPSGVEQPFKLIFGSLDGFLPDVRIDPGTRNGNYRITDLAFTCR